MYVRYFAHHVLNSTGRRAAGEGGGKNMVMELRTTSLSSIIEMMILLCSALDMRAVVFLYLPLSIRHRRRFGLLVRERVRSEFAV